MLGGADEKVSVRVELTSKLALHGGHHNRTARLFGTDISLGPGDALRYRDVTFTLDTFAGFMNEYGYVQGPPYIKIDCEAGQLQTLDIEGLLEILFAQEVLFVGTHA